MDKLKIALLCNGYDTTFRGSETFTSGIFELLKDDYDITIFSALTTQTKLRNQFRLPTRNLRAYGESNHFGRYLYKHNILDDYDLILNNAGFIGSYWCNKIRKKTGIRFVSFERGGGKEESINNLFKPDKIVYLTKHSYNQSKYKEKTYLPIGINVAEYQKKREIHPLMKDLEHPIFLSTSALVGFKRIPLIIDAVASLEKGTLLQTSDGNQKQGIFKYGTKMLGDRFQYTGNVDREVLLSLYQHSDCFVSASKHEAFGIVYLEALSSGLPIIAQADSRRREIVGDGGYLIDFTKESYRNATFKDYDVVELKPLQQAKKFDWKVLKSRYVELIEEIAG